MNFHQGRYDSDLTYAQWLLIKDFLPAPLPGGRPRPTHLKCVCNALFYLTKTGCQWRYLPKDYPPWQTVYGYYALWKREGYWEKINAHLSREVRLLAGKREYPSAGIVDSQSVKSMNKGPERGFDRGRLIKGRKRHILELIWADGGYTGEMSDWISKTFQLVLSIVRRIRGQIGFKLLPKRWKVERTFGWFNFYRRLAKDYEDLPQNSETIIYIAMIQIMLRRLATDTS